MVTNPTKWYKIWRHGRGFGIHSPLAYRLVTQVLRTQRRTRYYGESWARGLFSGRTRRRTAAMVLRLLADRNPASVAILAEGDDFGRWYRIVSATVTNARIDNEVRSDSCFIIVDRGSEFRPPHPAVDTPGVYTVFTRLSEPTVTALFRRQFVNGDFKGLILDSRRSAALCIERSGLPRQYIAARF